MHVQTIAEDKQRIIDQLRVNFANMPDGEEECALLRPQMAGTIASIISSLAFEDFRDAELQAYLSLLGPVRARTLLLGVPMLRDRRPLRRVV